jgi:type IV pilus assembly protein PilV
MTAGVLQGVLLIRSPNIPARSSRQRGVSLIEVLVSVLLLTFGIVGMAGLQFNGTKFNHSAYLRSQGTSLAYDVADRMRANLAESYLTGFADVFDVGVGPACGVALGAATALRDVNQWKSCLETVLPQGSGRVSRIAAGAVYTDQCGVNHVGIPDRAMFVVEVTWNNDRLQNENNVECVVVRTEVNPL